MSVLLQTVKVAKSFGEHEVLKEITLTIAEGERIGFVGKNGAGKSTLLAILAGSLKEDSGQIIWHQKKRISYLKQITDEWETDPKQNHILSGGERTKRLLRQHLQEGAGVLLLDEPTNHLDAEGMKWLIGEIKRFKGTVLMISHDRYFLDQCVSRIEEIEKGKNTSYPGNYSWYREEKKRRFEADTQAYLAEEKQKKKLQGEMAVLRNWSNKAHNEARRKAIETGNKFGGKEHNRAKAKKMDRRIHSQLMRLKKLETEGMKRPEAEKKVYFQLDPKEQKGSRILYAKALGMQFKNKVLFKASSFYIKRGEKVGIIGPNGCGKTTLIKYLLGETAAHVSGQLAFPNTRKLGYMSQEVLELDEKLSVRESFGRLSRKEEISVRNQLAGLGMSKRLYEQKIGTLSMGERMKLKLIKMILEGCEVLILDEPTNHMDLAMREQLEEVLEKYEGTVLLVSHDRYLVERICDHLLVFEEKEVKRFEGTLTEYEQKKKSIKKQEGIKNQDTAERLRREYRLTYLSSTLCMLPKDDPQYKVLEEEYQRLLNML